MYKLALAIDTKHLVSGMLWNLTRVPTMQLTSTNWHLPGGTRSVTTGTCNLEIGKWQVALWLLTSSSTRELTGVHLLPPSVFLLARL